MIPKFLSLLLSNALILSVYAIAIRPAIALPTQETSQAEAVNQSYGCLTGYPDGTFRGDRAVTRYEFAAALNACLNGVDDLLNRAVTNGVTPEELDTSLTQLEQYQQELDSLRDRLDKLSQ